MFRYIGNLVTGVVRRVIRMFRRVTGVGPDNIPDVLSIFTVASRVAVIALGALALLATIIPALSADPMAVRLLSASSSLWQAGTQAGYESRYGFPEQHRVIDGRSRRSSFDGSSPRVSVFEIDEDDVPTFGGGRRY